MMPLSDFPESFQADIAAWEARMLNPDPLNTDAPLRALRAPTLEGYQFTFRRLASALVRSGKLQAERDHRARRSLPGRQPQGGSSALPAAGVGSRHRLRAQDGYPDAQRGNAFPEARCAARSTPSRRWSTVSRRRTAERWASATAPALRNSTTPPSSSACCASPRRSTPGPWPSGIRCAAPRASNGRWPSRC